MKNLMYKVVRKGYRLCSNFLFRKQILEEKVVKEENTYRLLLFDELYNNLCGYDVISFDIFDTLITRSIYEPDDVFKLMGEKLRIDSFLEKRKYAEAMARNKYHKDVNLKQIYGLYKDIYQISLDEVNKIEKLEEELELKFCTPRADMLKLVKKLYNEDKTLILVSDMYLDKKVILKMLKKCGYNEKMFKNVYISSDVNKRKDTKIMWRYIRRIYRKYKLVHIGDNIYSDVIFPRRYKIDAIKIMSSRELFLNSSIYNSLSSYVVNRTVSDSIFIGTIVNKKLFNSPFSNLMINTIDDFGYVFHAPMLNEFLKFIVTQTSKMDELLFLAREGYYLQKLYQDYTELYNIKPKNNVYFLASRKATHTATLFDENDIYRLKEFNGTFKTFMNQIFDIATDDETPIVIPRDFDIVKEKIKPYVKEILRNAKKERKAYLRYIEQMIDKYDTKNISVIDLGYSGTIQYNLTKLTGKEIVGVYLTNSSNIKRYSSKSKLLYCFNTNENDYYKNVLYYSLLLEFFLSAPYGQLQKFTLNGNVSTPIYNNESLSKKKIKFLQSIYKQVQNYMNDLYEISTIYDLDINKELMVVLYVNIVDSGIVSQKVKDCFDFMDSFETSEVRNLFKILGKY